MFQVSNRPRVSTMTEAADPNSHIVRSAYKAPIREIWKPSNAIDNYFEELNQHRYRDKEFEDLYKQYQDSIQTVIDNANQKIQEIENSLVEEDGEYVESPEESTPASENNTGETDNQVPRYNPEVNKEQRSRYAGNPSLFFSDYMEACDRLHIPKKLAYNMFVKDAVESKWGAKNQSKNNFGNLQATPAWKKANPNAQTVKGNDRHRNGTWYHPEWRVYNTIDDYIKDQYKLLTGTYTITASDDISTFTKKLEGSNPGRRHYSETDGYGLSLQDLHQTLKNEGYFNG